MPPLRVIHDPPAAGDWNMAVDEALADSVGQGGPPTLRFYTWSQATLSLGYFQSIGDRPQHPSSVECPVVRRASGGGAIVHDRELTYSLVVPSSTAIVRDPQTLYQIAHDTLRAVLASLGVAAQLRESASLEAPFLCFQRRAVGDVLCRSVKIAGSAQRRRRQAVIQHGSVLLERSTYCPELAGIGELTGISISTEELAAAWTTPLAKRMSLTPLLGELNEDENAAAAQVCASKFGDNTWTTKR